MLFDVDPSELKQAKNAHELMMFNLAVIHIFAPVGLLAMGADPVYMVIPLVLAMGIIAFVFFKGRRLQSSGPWFVMVHWKLAFRRCQWLMIAYLITAIIMGAGLLIASGIDQKTSREILITVVSRFGVMPTVLMVMVSFVLESAGIQSASKGEVPDVMVKRFPPQ